MFGTGQNGVNEPVHNGLAQIDGFGAFSVHDRHVADSQHIQDAFEISGREVQVRNG